MRIPSLYHLAVGYATLAVAPPHIAPLLELCRREGLAYIAFSTTPDGTATLTMTALTARHATALCRRLDLPVAVVDRGGLPILARRLLGRPGLVVGGLLGVLLVVAASSVVWDIRVTGNDTLPARAVEESLAAAGFSVGTLWRGFRADVTENTVLLSDDRLSWISVNRRGTVAYVEVREAARRPEPTSDTPADVVASINGVIERVELTAGNVLVRAGDTVAEGQILVSGLYDSLVEGIRMTRAAARVYARTTRVLTVTIPLSYEQKTHTVAEDAITREKYVTFFGKDILFSKKTGNDGGVCDIIVRESSLTPIRDVGFPLSVTTVWYLPYEITTATRTHAEAEELAYIELSRRIAALPGGAEVREKTITTYRTSDAFILQCTLVSVEDIAAVREIEVGK